jgi:mono/diheme cytochrome c family protein
MTTNVKTIVFTAALSAVVLFTSMGEPALSQVATTSHSENESTTNAMPPLKRSLIEDTKSMPGYRLFDHNCAPCHGDDARGDEGPTLYDLRKSDARIEKIIKNGIKGEMPSFSKKFNDADVQALIAYLRTLKDK